MIKKILLDYEDGEDGWHYLTSPLENCIWIATFDYVNHVGISLSYGFSEAFKKDIAKFSDIFNASYATQKQADLDLKTNLENIGFKIIGKEMQIYI